MDPVSAQGKRRAASAWLVRGLWRAAVPLVVLMLAAMSSGSLMIVLLYAQQGLIDVLVSRDADGFWRWMGVMGLLVLAMASAAWARKWLEGVAAQRLRAAWSTLLLRRYAQVQLRLEAQAGQDVMAEQRLADDVGQLAEGLCRLLNGASAAVVRTLGAAWVLWTVAGAVNVAGLEVPGFMFWFSVVVGVVTMVVTHRAGRALGPKETARVDALAAMRQRLMRWREHRASVALLRGLRREARAALDGVRQVCRAGLRAGRTRARMAGLGELMGPSDLLGWLILAPGYLAGRYSLGQIFQVSNAHGMFTSAVGWFVDEYASFVSLVAARDRLQGFACALDAAAADQPRHQVTTGTRWHWDGRVSVPGPEGWRALDLVSAVEFEPGRHTLLVGPSGAGKSVWLQALAGCWPHWTGSLQRPVLTTVQIVPQRSYLPSGSLAAVLAYPESVNRLDRYQAGIMLAELGMSKLASRLDDVVPWHHELSGGEAQRVALVRACLKRPQWLLLDEATNALDEAVQEHVVRWLLARPGCTVLCIAHDLRLARMFDHVLEVASLDPTSRALVQGGIDSGPAIAADDILDELNARYAEPRRTVARVGKRKA